VTIDPRIHDAVIFDLDGVVTDTASIHAAAWASMFNDFLQRRQRSDDEKQSPFTDDDYRHFVDGKPRGDGVTDFLASRGISLSPGSPADNTDGTISGLGERKQDIFLDSLHAGVPVFESTVVLVRKLADAGIATGVYSASRNCEQILKDAGLGDLFSVRVDGVVADELKLPGKPDPAVLFETTRRLGAVPGRSVVIEDAEAGVEAGSRGGFALVIGVDRTGHAEELRSHGADVVVSDLTDVTVRAGDKLLSRPPCKELGLAGHDHGHPG
jgi:HAD superfamily hydrolase (TIGR01509 family)